MMYYRAALDFEDTAYEHKLIKQLKSTFFRGLISTYVIEPFVNISESWICAKNTAE